MIRTVLVGALLLIVSVGTTSWADSDSQNGQVDSLLGRAVIDPKLPLEEVRAFAAQRVLPMPAVTTIEDWEINAARIREEFLERIVYRGEAASWRDAETKVEWLETIEGGPGYQIRKLRYEALPGLWIPALLYVPDNLTGRVPVVMNVNGHEPLGKAVDYKQIRCINQAKRGMLALNPEWLGMGQLATTNFRHYRMNQIDLCGTSGLSPFYLTMKRGLDVLLSLEHADPDRVAVAGLSGGGWQTILISSLDPRVTLANPVAGYSPLSSRVDQFDELGDSEQTPVDMGITADYSQLTALRAPRPTLLTYNAYDQCCFKAENALPPLLEAAGPVFKLYGKPANLRSHVNFIPGNHNFKLDNRLELYRMFGQHFFAGQADYAYEEFPSEDEVKTKEELHVEIPSDNADFHTLAMSLAQDLPRNSRLPSQSDDVGSWQSDGRKRLAEVVRSRQYDVQAIPGGTEDFDSGTATFWRLRLGGQWTVPAVELVRGTSTSTVILLADEGRKSTGAEALKLLDAGHRVLAVDPFYFGESKIIKRDFLFALLVSAVGERALGIQSDQVSAISRWANGRDDTTEVRLHAVGPRCSVIALVAAGLEPDAIGGLTLDGAYGSLKEVLEQNISVETAPELFCFGLLEQFDVKQLAALVAPRPVAFVSATERAVRELTDLKAFYEVHGVDFDPLR